MEYEVLTDHLIAGSRKLAKGDRVSDVELGEDTCKQLVAAKRLKPVSVKSEAKNG